MFCTNCGKQIPDESKFCTSCGMKTSYNVQIDSSEMIKNKLNSTKNRFINKTISFLSNTSENGVETRNSNHNYEQQMQQSDMGQIVSLLSSKISSEKQTVQNKTKIFLNDVIQATENSKILPEQKIVNNNSEQNSTKADEEIPSITQNLIKGAYLIKDAKDEKRKEKESKKSERKAEKEYKETVKKEVKERKLSERIEANKTQKMDGFVIAGYIMSVLGNIFPLFSLIGTVLFVYSFWHIKTYNRRGKQLAIAGIFISVITAAIGLFVLYYILPLLSSFTNLTDALGSAANSIGDTADNINSIIDS